MARPVPEPTAIIDFKKSIDVNYCISSRHCFLGFLTDAPRPVCGECRYRARGMGQRASFRSIAFRRPSRSAGRATGSPLAVLPSSHTETACWLTSSKLARRCCDMRRATRQSLRSRGVTTDSRGGLGERQSCETRQFAGPPSGSRKFSRRMSPWRWTTNGAPSASRATHASRPSA